MSWVSAAKPGVSRQVRLGKPLNGRADDVDVGPDSASFGLRAGRASSPLRSSPSAFQGCAEADDTRQILRTGRSRRSWPPPRCSGCSPGPRAESALRRRWAAELVRRHGSRSASRPAGEMAAFRTPESRRSEATLRAGATTGDLGDRLNHAGLVVGQHQRDQGRAMAGQHSVSSGEIDPPIGSTGMVERPEPPRGRWHARPRKPARCRPCPAGPDDWPRSRHW